jgi:putative peptidoglycan binding protein
MTRPAPTRHTPAKPKPWRRLVTCHIPLVTSPSLRYNPFRLRINPSHITPARNAADSVAGGRDRNLMKRQIITLLIGGSLTFAAGVQRGQAQFPNIKTPKVRVTVPHVPSVRLNKNVTVFTPRHLDFHATPSSTIVGVTFNQDFRIKGATNWKGAHYEVFRTYRPQWHDRVWWNSNHKHVVLIGGGWYYWNAGYWYPAWGYDQTAAYYPYDGPIYVGKSAKPFDQIVADVQTVLQEQGLYKGEVDGLVGPLTQEALAAYQTRSNLEPTGTLDQPTLESLGMG